MLKIVVIFTSWAHLELVRLMSNDIQQSTIFIFKSMHIWPKQTRKLIWKQISF
jgi:hypothetical protein